MALRNEKAAGTTIKRAWSEVLDRDTTEETCQSLAYESVQGRSKSNDVV
jgi:hypothetical protein